MIFLKLFFVVLIVVIAYFVGKHGAKASVLDAIAEFKAIEHLAVDKARTLEQVIRQKLGLG